VGQLCSIYKEWSPSNNVSSKFYNQEIALYIRLNNISVWGIIAYQEALKSKKWLDGLKI